MCNDFILQFKRCRSYFCRVSVILFTKASFMIAAVYFGIRYHFLHEHDALS